MTVSKDISAGPVPLDLPMRGRLNLYPHTNVSLIGPVNVDALEEGELEEILSSEISTREGRYYGFYDHALRSLLIEKKNQPTRFLDISEPLQLEGDWLPEILDRKVFVFAQINTTNCCYWIFSSYDLCQLWEIKAIPL